jgi:DNA-directed RNA polymerase subunit alpha
VAYAARILQDQLSIFVNFDEPESAKARTRSGRVWNSTRCC